MGERAAMDLKESPLVIKGSRLGLKTIRDLKIGPSKTRDWEIANRVIVGLITSLFTSYLVKENTQECLYINHVNLRAIHPN